MSICLQQECLALSCNHRKEHKSQRKYFPISQSPAEKDSLTSTYSLATRGCSKHESNKKIDR